MRVDELLSFCAVVRQGSFTRAAGELFLSQSAVSRQVRSLERSLGLPLIDRSGRKAIPTEAGEAVFHYGQELLERATAIRSIVDAIKGLEGGRLIIGAGAVVGNYVLPTVVAHFHRQFPHVSLELRAEPAARVLELVAHGSVDFGIALVYDLPTALQARPLYEEPMVLVVSPRHPLANRWREPLPQAAIAQIPLVTLGGPAILSRRLYEDWLKQARVEPRVTLEMNSYEQVKRVIAAGDGAAFMFRSSVAAELQTGLLRLLEVSGPPLRGTFMLLTRQRQYLSPAARRFLQFLGEALVSEGLVEDIHVPTL